jgi:formylglycine-generating enzyme
MNARVQPDFAQPALVHIPEGWFQMGCEVGQDVEQPVHRVWVDGFLIAETQVTVAEYARFLQATGAAPPPFWHDPNFNRPQQPVVAVSWFEAVAYCEWLTSMSERPLEGERPPSHYRLLHYRLPTEAEWERAARGGVEGMLYPWGNEAPLSRPGYAERWKQGPEPVRQSEPNPYGLFEMCENVHEWCADWFDAGYYAVSPERNPTGPPSGERKASRGGSWRHHIKISRCSARSSIPPAFQYADYGFRVVRSLSS